MTDRNMNQMQPCAGRNCGSTNPNLHSAECFEDYERTTGMSNCPDCERYKESAKNWRHKAYELSGHPLPWKRGDTWIGLTDDDIQGLHYQIKVKGMGVYSTEDIYRAIEAKLKEKNGG